MPKTANVTPGDVPLLPWEQGAATSEDGVDSLFDALASDPDGDETSMDTDEPAPEDEKDSGDPEEEESDEDDDSEEESDEDEEESDDGEEEPGELHEVTLPGGEKQKVTLEELKKGYSRTADYTRKTQQAAEDRKALETDRASIREAREQYSQQLDLVAKALEALQPAEPDWDKLHAENPTEFAAQWADHQRRQQQLATVKAEQERVAREQAEDQRTRLEAYLNEQRQKLVEAIPAWKDPEKASSEKKKLMDYAMNAYGYTEQELGSVYDHRVMLILRKAAAYDELQTKGKGKLREQVKGAKVLQPGGKPAEKNRGKRARVNRGMDQLARSGRVTDAAAVFMDLLPEDE